MPYRADTRYVPARTIIKASWLLLAVAINALEMFFPRLPFLPWLKPGFANMITILWIVRFGTRDALAYTVIRVWISGFYFGFSFITLGLALSGGILSTIVMGLAWKILGRRKLIGTIGIGILGALFHNIGQIGAVYVLMTQNGRLFYQVPFMFGASVVFGGAVGALVPGLSTMFDWVNDSRAGHHSFQFTNNSTEITAGSVAGIAAVVALCVVLLFVSNIPILCYIAVGATLAAQILTGFSLRTLMHPARFYSFFLFIAIMNLFLSYGTRYSVVPFITHEGVRDTVVQSLRLWCWLQTVSIFRKLQFQSHFFGLLRIFFPRQNETLFAALIAVEFFPELMKFTKDKTSFPRASLLKHPHRTLSTYVYRVYGHILRILTEQAAPRA